MAMLNNERVDKSAVSGELGGIHPNQGARDTSKKWTHYKRLPPTYFPVDKML